MSKQQSPFAVFFALRNALEHNPATVYKAVYLGEMVDAVRRFGWGVECHDLDVDTPSLTKYIEVFLKSPSLILIWCDVHQARLAKQIAELAKKVSPETPVLVYGRATAFMPQYFERPPFDAIHVSGDREAAIIDYIETIGTSRPPAGWSIFSPEEKRYVRHQGQRLAPANWPVPSLVDLPLDKYAEFTRNTHGKDYRTRLAITVSKGCDFGCAYCGAPQEEGAIDRRRPISHVFKWIDESGFKKRSETLHLFASTLFANRTWMRDFCNEYIRRGDTFTWRGVTTIKSLLNEEIIHLAGKARCIELAVGIETLSRSHDRTAKSSISELESVIKMARNSGIRLKGLVMLGYPGQNEDDVLRLEEFAQEWGIMLRYTGYTPLHQLRSKTAVELDAITIESYDRRTYFDAEATDLSADFFFERIVRNGGYYVPSDMNALSV
ncbi:MAG: radical SAM protein [Azospirillaceae bacterium]|nr:radical SAM protein [Azospirillaceae bacterium]